MLVAAGASLTIKDFQGNTPRALAQSADDQELAAYLESKCQLLSLGGSGLESGGDGGDSIRHQHPASPHSHSLRGSRHHTLSKRQRVERLI